MRRNPQDEKIRNLERKISGDKNRIALARRILLIPAWTQDISSEEIFRF